MRIGLGALRIGEKILSWGPLSFSTIEKSTQITNTFRICWPKSILILGPFEPYPPLAKAILGARPGQRPAWSPKSWTPLTPNAKVPLICQFYCVFLRVGVTKYCKLQGKMLTGSATGSSYLSRALYQHRENPKCKHCLGKKLDSKSNLSETIVKQTPWKYCVSLDTSSG